MKDFVVSLEIVTHSVGLTDLSSALGLYSNSDSYDKSDNGLTAWREFSSAPDGSPLEIHFKSVVEKTKRLDFLAIKEKKEDLSLQLIINIAAMFNTANCSIALSREIVDFSWLYHFDIHLTYYPCE